jgi:phosphoribosylanthranilate isomerase
VPILRAVHLAADGGAALEPSVPEHAPVLLDAPDPVRHGGTGRTVDWTRARVVASTRTVVLAGGLTHRNVARAIREVRPYGVDVASGVESEPGVKVAGLLEAFARQVHAAWADRDTEERS